jgi:hypothetical protein
LYSALQGVEPNWLVSWVWAEPQFGQATAAAPAPRDAAMQAADVDHLLGRRRDAVAGQRGLAGLAHPVGGPGRRQRFTSRTCATPCACSASVTDSAITCIAGQPE